MGGEGSMLHMINILRSNKSLLRRKPLFKRERTFLSRKKEYYKATGGKLDLKKATKEELALVRQKVIRQRKVESIINWSVVLIAMGIVIGLGIYYVKLDEKRQLQMEDTAKDNYLKEHINLYVYLIEEGDNWIEKRHWSNAIYFYKQAVDLFPDDYEANYRLALAYSYHCQYENKNCEAGKKLTERLLKYFPEKPELQAL